MSFVQYAHMLPKYLLNRRIFLANRSVWRQVFCDFRSLFILLFWQVLYWWTSSLTLVNGVTALRSLFTVNPVHINYFFNALGLLLKFVVLNICYVLFHLRSQFFCSLKLHAATTEMSSVGLMLYLFIYLFLSVSEF